MPSLPSTVPTGSRRITPYLALNHDWLLPGSAGGVAGRIERWRDADQNFECQANTDRTATWNYQEHPTGDTSIKIRPMHAEFLDEFYPGASYQSFAANPRINTFAWDFLSQFFPDTDVERGVFYYSKGEFQKDKKHGVEGADGERRAWVWNPLTNYARNAGDPQTSFAEMRQWCRHGLRRRPFFHALSPSANVWNPTKLNAGYGWNEKTAYAWGQGQKWQEDDSAWTGEQIYTDQDTLEEDNYHNWNALDKGHNETIPQLCAALAGHPEGYVYLWKMWEWYTSLSPGWDRISKQHDNQPRAGGYAIKNFIVFYLAGFEWADPDLIAELTGGFYGQNSSRGWKPSEMLDYAIRWILTDRFTGGIGDGGAGAYMDQALGGNDNILNLICQGALTLYDDRGDQDPDNDIYWWYHNGVPTMRIPCYGDYVWQPMLKLWSFVFARKFYDYMGTYGVQPFGSDVYQGLGEALDYFGHYFYKKAVPVNGPVGFMAQGEMAYSCTVDCYHDTFDQQIAGNRYHYETKELVDLDLIGEPLDLFLHLQDDFLNICNKSKWEDNNRAFLVHDNGKCTVLDQDGTKTAHMFAVVVFAYHFGTASPEFQMLFHSTAMKTRSTGDDYTSEWIKYVDALYALLALEDRDPNQDIDQRTTPVLVVSRAKRNPPGLPIPGSAVIAKYTLPFKTKGLLAVSRTTNFSTRTVTLRSATVLGVARRKTSGRSISLNAPVSLEASSFSGHDDGFTTEPIMRVTRRNIPPHPHIDRNFKVITTLEVSHEVTARAVSFTSRPDLRIDTDLRHRPSFVVQPTLEIERLLSRAEVAFSTTPTLTVSRIASAAMSFSSLPRPVLEPAQIDPSSGEVRLRVWRIPSDILDAGGYRIYRSTRREGFAGTLGTDFELLAENVTQPDSGTTYSDKVLTGQPTDTDLWYRVVAIDSFSSESLRSQPSNVVWVRWLGTRQIQVPVMPCELQPSFGPLKGILPDLQNYDTEAGITWFEFRASLVSAGEALWEELRHSQDDASASNLFRDPPPDLCNWFRWQCVLELLPLCGLQPEELDERIALARRYRGEARDEFLDEAVTFAPGGAPAPTHSIRVRR